MSAASARWMSTIAPLGCVVGKRHAGCQGPVELHHVAEGSGLRSDFSAVPICAGHHRGPGGFHGMGGKAFIRLYRPPGDSEYGLLVWLCEDLAKAGLLRIAA